MSKITVIFALIMSIVAGGCSKTSKYRIGVSQCSSDDWRQKLNDEMLREELLHDNIEIEILSAEDSSDKQKEDLRYFASNDFDIIIASPNEVDAVTPVLDSIYNAGIPLIIFDRHTNTDRYTSFQGADNKAVGAAVAKYAQSLSNLPRILEIEGNLETSPAIDRHNGFIEYADSTDNIEVLASAVGYWTYEGSVKVTDSLLRLYPQTNIIYAHNDRMAIGAAHVKDSIGRSDIKVIGIDASPEIGMKAVLDNVIDATFIYPTEGRRLVKTAMAILEGKSVEKNVIIPTRTAVDKTNAEILLVQTEALKEETNNIHELRSHLSRFLEQYSTQKTMLYGAVAILLLLAATIFFMLRNFWNQRRSRREIESRNRMLSTQRDEIEEQNRQLQQKNEEINDVLAHLQQATQSKLTFFTNVSHDLRTPLTLIAEPVSQIVDAENLTESQRRLMMLANKNIKILMRLINQVLDFRKYENSALSLNLSEVDIVKEVDEWTCAFRELATKKHVKFRVNLPKEDGSYMMAIDIDKIERVLFNLVANAFKFTPENGSVGVSMSRDEMYVYLTVSDSGKGIAEDEIEKIFERFFRTEEVNPRGSGIGLALSKAFVELHGGTITVDSKVSKGSVFTVKLPIRHIERSVNENTPMAVSLSQAEVTAELADVGTMEISPMDNSRTLLVIDDNADIRTLIASLMGDEYTVIQASGGQQGIKLATKYVPDVIICDVMMPDVDGYETCRRLKGEITTSHIPVLMLTACALDEQRIAGYDCGADGYLTKPFTAEMLMSRVNALVENRRRMQERYVAHSFIEPPTSEVSPTHTLENVGNAGNIDDEFYRRFVKIIGDRLSESNLGIDDVASAMGVSRVQLYRKIKALTNYSPTDLIRNIRLQKASAMLKTTSSTVAEICYAVGFSSHSYFTKCYREYFGESPSDAQRRTSKL